MKFLDYNNIRMLNTEQTSRCNLFCPQCARTDPHTGKLNRNITLKDISVDDYKRIAPSEFYSKLKLIDMCGNYGDAIASKNIIEVLEFFTSLNEDVIFRIHTNGSLRSKSWWRKLARTLTEKSVIIFSIDGLRDTSKLYRVYSNFDKAIENAKAFIEAGGNAKWNYIVFDHNYHQVEEARKLAEKVGFYNFTTKISARFTHTRHYKKNEGVGQGKTIVEKYGTWENYINITTIRCRYKQHKAIYIDHDLNLWPCCWVGGPMFFHDDKNVQKVQLKKVLSGYDPGFNSLKKRTIKEVLEHKWFSEDLPSSWSKSMEDGKLLTCGRTCGTDYHFCGEDKKIRKETYLNE